MMNNDFKRLNRGLGTSRDITIKFIQQRQPYVEGKPNLNDSGGLINVKVET